MQTTENKRRRPSLIAKETDTRLASRAMPFRRSELELRHNLVGAKRLTDAQVYPQQVLAVPAPSVMMRRTK
jgi:hypothetical protein